MWQQLKKAWAVWKRIAHKIGDFQARVLLTVIYAVLILPFGLVVRWFSDPLNIKKPPLRWFDHPHETSNLQQARQQG